MAPTKVIEAIKAIVEYSYDDEEKHFEEEYDIVNAEDLTIAEIQVIDFAHIYYTLRVLSNYLDDNKYGEF